MTTQEVKTAQGAPGGRAGLEGLGAALAHLHQRVHGGRQHRLELGRRRGRRAVAAAVGALKCGDHLQQLLHALRHLYWVTTGLHQPSSLSADCAAASRQNLLRFAMPECILRRGLKAPHFSYTASKSGTFDNTLTRHTHAARYLGWGR